jgi:multidrug efflux pump subunit AcrB
MMLTLVPPSQRKLNQSAFSTELRKALGGIPGLKAVVQDMSMQGVTAQRGFPVEFTVRGPDWSELAAHSAALMAELADAGAVVDLDTDYRVGMPELRIVPDPARAADLGVSSEQLATAVNALVGGIRVGRFTTGGRRIDLRLRLLANQRSRPEDLAQLRVRTRGGELVPLSTLVKQEERPELQTIMRTDRERAISVFANVRPGHSQAEALELVERLGRDLPPGYSVTLGGASATFRESTGQLLFALVLGIMVAYMILASQFNSFLHPVTVLTVLPLSVAGGVAALWAAGMSLNVFSMIGLLLLVGIAKKNSIILVDCANNARDTGLDARQAMQVAGPIRLRPILMTSVATMMAAVPPALGLGPGAETRAPMAIGILGGVFVSTVLSLLVVPAFYVIADRLFGHRRKEPAA